MFSSLVTAGQVLQATQINNLRKDAGLFSGDEVNITYNTNGTVNTIEHVDYGVTLTLSYNSDLTIASVTDGTNTWAYTYDTQKRLTKIKKA